jgi:putative intracellular protease/amidase
MTHERRTNVSKHVAMVIAGPAVSPVTGWPVGFWWSELTHAFWEFEHAGYEVTLASPEGGPVVPDAYSDPDDPSGYSADDWLSRGFKASPNHAALLQSTTPLADLDLDALDAIFFVGGQSPMITFRHNRAVEQAVSTMHGRGRPTALVCHATCVLLDAVGSDGKLIVSGRTWTGFANSEEDYADRAVGRVIQPFRIEDEASKLETDFVVREAFAVHAVADGNLITGQQQHSGAAAARLVIAQLEGGR